MLNSFVPTDPCQREVNNLNDKLFDIWQWHSPIVPCVVVLLKCSDIKNQNNSGLLKPDIKMVDYEMICHLLNQRSRWKHVIDEGM
jgi:hypothetical protein